MPDLTRVSGVGNGNSVLLKNLFQYKLLKNLFQDKLLQDIEQSFPGCTVGSCHQSSLYKVVCVLQIPDLPLLSRLIILS